MSTPGPDNPIANPPPLNAVANFPYRVTAFPCQWLLQYTSLGRVAAPAPLPPAQKAAAPKSLESL